MPLILTFSPPSLLLRKITATLSPFLLALTCLAAPYTGLANDEQTPETINAVAANDDESTAAIESALDDVTLDDALQQLKSDVLALNRDLFILKEELLFPAHTQIAVFLSLDVGEFFQLDAINVKLDDKPVASHLYTPRQTNALMRGGVQRLYLGNVKNGEHEITAVFTGRGPQGRDYRRAANLSFAKGDEATHLELKITDSARLLQPEFSIVEWN